MGLSLGSFSCSVMRASQAVVLCMFSSDVGFNLGLSGMVIGERGVHLSQAQLRILIRDLFGRESLFIENGDRSNRNTGAVNARSPAKHSGRPNDQRADIS